MNNIVCCEEERVIFFQKAEPYPNHLHEVDLSGLPHINKQTQTKERNPGNGPKEVATLGFSEK